MVGVYQLNGTDARRFLHSVVVVVAVTAAMITVVVCFFSVVSPCAQTKSDGQQTRRRAGERGDVGRKRQDYLEAVVIQCHSLNG